MKQKKKGILAGACVLIVLAAILVGVVIYQNTPGQKYRRQISLGNKYLSEMDYDAAELAFRSAIRIDDRQTDGYLGVAKALRGSAENTDDTEEKLKKYDEAAEACEQAAVIEPTLLEPYRELAATRIIQAQLIYPTDETAAKTYYDQAQQAAESASANGASDAAASQNSALSVSGTVSEETDGTSQNAPAAESDAASGTSGTADSGASQAIVLPSFEAVVRPAEERDTSGGQADSSSGKGSDASSPAASGNSTSASSEAAAESQAQPAGQTTETEREKADRALQLTQADTTVDLAWNLQDGTLTIPDMPLSSAGWLAFASGDLLKTASPFTADLGAFGVNEYLLYAYSPYILNGTVQHLVLTSEDIHSTTDITFTLDENGRLNQVQETYTSDIEESNTNVTAEYAYDEQGRLTKLTRTEDPLVFFGSIREMTFTYASDGTLSAYDVERYGGDPSSNGHYAVSYDADGRIGAVTHEMDLDGENGSETISWQYAYNAEGNLESVTDSDSAYPDDSSTINFQYDETGRLTGLETSDGLTAGVLWKSASEASPEAG